MHSLTTTDDFSTPGVDRLLCCSGSIDDLTVHSQTKQNKKSYSLVNIEKKSTKTWQVSTPDQIITAFMISSYRCSITFVTSTVPWHFIFSLLEKKWKPIVYAHTHTEYTWQKHFYVVYISLLFNPQNCPYCRVFLDEIWNWAINSTKLW